MKLRAFAVGVALCLGPAVAGAADDSATALAKSHVAAIAKGDATTLIAEYAPGAYLWWVGGALDGTYSGAAIADLWKTFARTPRALTPTVNAIVQYVGANGMTITADVTYSGAPGATTAPMLHVFHTLVLRDGKIQDEIWQVVPPPAT